MNSSQPINFDEEFVLNLGKYMSQKKVGKPPQFGDDGMVGWMVFQKHCNAVMEEMDVDPDFRQYLASLTKKLLDTEENPRQYQILRTEARILYLIYVGICAIMGEKALLGREEE